MNILYISVNGYIIEKEILRYSNADSKNYYYPAQLFNSNLDNPDEFGGYALITPDKESLKKFCFFIFYYTPFEELFTKLM